MYAHVGKTSDDFTPEQLDFLAKHFDFITIEKLGASLNGGPIQPLFQKTVPHVRSFSGGDVPGSNENVECQTSPADRDQAIWFPSIAHFHILTSCGPGWLGEFAADAARGPVKCLPLQFQTERRLDRIMRSGNTLQNLAHTRSAASRIR